MMLVMCRESRRILDELNRQASMNNVQGLTTPAHIYICDRLVCEYYTSPLINILKQRIKGVRNKEWKHFTIDYWEPVIRKNLKNATGTHRDGVNIGYGNAEAFHYVISNYLIADYSLTDAITLNRLVNTTPFESIRRACEEAKKYGVREIRYINAIIEREKAEQKLRADGIDALSNKIGQSDRLMSTVTHRHSPIEIAIAQHNYHQAMQNADLERRFKEVFGDD